MSFACSLMHGLELGEKCATVGDVGICIGLTLAEDLVVREYLILLNQKAHIIRNIALKNSGELSGLNIAEFTLDGANRREEVYVIGKEQECLGKLFSVVTMAEKPSHLFAWEDIHLYVLIALPLCH
ncbi:hypothetical protein VNO77_20339 [Canavalia gladiata]|uniref:Uncharacterized protein n=1 Tax=Canavalia gladiata TaxID=3824 RepID=A0AAN9LP20_CANGL